MNKVTFLRTLRFSLKGLPETEIADIVRDYEEHFNIGISKGKMEEEISAELGDPVELAKNYIDLDHEHTVEEDPPSVHSVYRNEEPQERYYRENGRRSSGFQLNGMALVGVIFLTGLIVIPILGGWIGVLGGLFAVAASLGFGGVISLIGASGIFGIPGAFAVPFLVGLCLFLCSLSGLCFYGLGFLVKWSFRAVVAYFRWCWRMSGGVSNEE